MHSDNSIKKIVINYLIALIPLIIYGFYKNGIVPYINYNHQLSTLFKPLIIPIGAFIIGYLSDKLFKESNISFTPLLTTISAMIIPINSPIIIYFISLIISILLAKTIFKKINYSLIPKLLLAIISLTITSYSYLNVYEINTNIHYDMVDLLFGRSYGGIAATSTIICLLSYIFLFNTGSYKKEIPPIIIGSFIAFSLCFIPELGIKEVTHRFLNSTIIFASIFIATIPMYSPITKKETIIYSLFIGLTSSLLVNTINIYESPYIILLITPLILKIYRKLYH